MTQLKVLNAYHLILQMYRTKGLPFAVCKALFTAKNMLQPHVDCQIEQENIIVEELGGSINNDGVINVPDDKKAELVKRMKDIRTTEVEIKTPIKLNLNEEQINKLDITGETLEILDGIIDIVEVE